MRITRNWSSFALKISGNTVKYLLLIVVSFICLLPFYWMVVSVLKTGPEIQSINIVWFPSNPQWFNFVAGAYYMVPPVQRALLNSALVYGSHTVLLLLASSLTGFVLAKYEFKGKQGIFFWIVSQLTIPGFIGMIPSYILMTWFGWVDTYWSLIIPGLFSAYSIFLMRQYIITIPDDILDAARLYGCSELGLFWRIVLPLSKPALAAVGLINFVWGWNDFLWPMLMIHDRQNYTVQQAIAGLWDVKDNLNALPLVAANVVFAAIPLIILTIVTSKHLIKGWTGLSYAKR